MPSSSSWSCVFPGGHVGERAGGGESDFLDATLYQSSLSEGLYWICKPFKSIDRLQCGLRSI